MSKRNFEADVLMRGERGLIDRKRGRTSVGGKVVRVNIERGLSLALALGGTIIWATLC